jgi:predicted ATP-dependent Lon-type protease
MVMGTSIFESGGGRVSMVEGGKWGTSGVIILLQPSRRVMKMAINNVLLIALIKRRKASDQNWKIGDRMDF